MKDKLQYLSLPPDSELREQLIGPEFTLNSRDEILLEPKDLMKRRGGRKSRHRGCVRLRVATLPVRDWEGSGDHLVKSEWNPFASEWIGDGAMQSAERLNAPRYYAPGWAKLREDD
jgi:hypothetical protein